MGHVFAIDKNNNIYMLSSSSRNSALGNIKINSDNISSIFDAPITFKDNNPNIYFSYNNKFEGLIEVFHLGYNIYSSVNSNIGLGLVQRSISDNFYTNDAWNDNGDNIPNIEELNYSQITKFSDQEIGLLISYNNFINDNSIIGFNIKPNYHTIGLSNAIGLSFDLKFLKSINSNTFIIGANDFLSIKKWNSGLKEKYDYRFFFNYSYKFKKILVCIEYDNYSAFKAGFEYKVNKQFAIQLGSDDSNLSLGIGFKSDALNINYAYLHNNSIDFDQSHKLGFLFKINKN